MAREDQCLSDDMSMLVTLFTEDKAMSQQRTSRKAQDDPIGIYPVDFEINVLKTALLIIDMQKYGYHPDFALGKLLRKEAPEVFSYLFSRLQDIVIPNITRLLSFFRENQLRVLYLAVGPLLPDGSDMIAHRRSRDLFRLRRTETNHFFNVGTPEHEILDQLKPMLGELVIYKNSASAFNSTAIDQILRNMKIENLVMTGASTNGCVETTARDAADRGYNCFLVDDGCATKQAHLHEATMENFELFFGKVVTTEGLIKELSVLLKNESTAIR